MGSFLTLFRFGLSTLSAAVGCRTLEEGALASPLFATAAERSALSIVFCCFRFNMSEEVFHPVVLRGRR
ncbi:MAG TPA: hypothetical protein VF118_17660, partial [Gemmatimonadaceae bacterium]